MTSDANLSILKEADVQDALVSSIYHMDTDIPIRTEPEPPIPNSNNVILSDVIPKIEVNEGLEFWNRRREEWTAGKWRTPVDSSNAHNPYLANINDRKHGFWRQLFRPNNNRNIIQIYDALVVERKRFVRPIPLPHVIKILVNGWKRDGTWPANQEAPPDSS